MFKWFGSKWQSAKRYPAPEHDRINEPFAGGAGYSLNYCDRQVTIWDADPQLLDLWTWLIYLAKPSDVLEIPIGLPPGTVIPDLRMSLGQSLLLKHWQRTNNVGNCWTVSAWGHLPGQWTAHTRSRVADEVHAIKHWQLSRALHDSPWSSAEKATWFVDGPYLYNYRYSRALPEFDFGALAANVRSITDGSLVIVCEAACKKTGHIPSYLPFWPSHESVTSRRKPTQAHHSREALYVRHPNGSENVW